MPASEKQRALWRVRTARYERTEKGKLNKQRRDKRRVANGTNAVQHFIRRHTDNPDMETTA